MTDSTTYWQEICEVERKLTLVITAINPLLEQYYLCLWISLLEHVTGKSRSAALIKQNTALRRDNQKNVAQDDEQNLTMLHLGDKNRKIITQ
jgi:hypothetical protein